MKLSLNRSHLMMFVTVAAAAGLIAVLDASIPTEVALLGVVIGLVYTLLAVAISITERVSGVVNLAIGSVGAMATTTAVIFISYDLPWILAVLIGLSMALALSVAIETVVLNRLSAAPRMIAVMATAATAVALARLGAELSDTYGTGDPGAVSNPTFIPNVEIGSYRLASGVVLLAVLVPLLSAIGAWVLLRTKSGLMLQASADDVELARLGGIPAGRLNTFVWAVAGGIAALLALFGPFAAGQVLQELPNREVLGVPFAGQAVFRLVIWPLIIAAVARGRDIPLMVVAGVTLGVVEEAMIWNGESRIVGPTFAFSLLLVAAVTLRYDSPRAEPGSSWLSVHVDAGWPAHEAAQRWRRLQSAPALLGLVVAVAVGISLDADNAADMAAWIGLAILGLAMFVEAGLAGSLSFGYLPMGAIGSLVTIFVTAETGSLPLGLALGVVLGGLLGAGGGLLELAVGRLGMLAASMAFLIVAFNVFDRFSFTYNEPGLPIINGAPATPHMMLAMTGVLGVVVFLVVRSLHRSRGGRALVAARDNRLAAQAFGYEPRRLRMAAGAVSGALSALGGALLMQTANEINPDRFAIFMAFVLMFAVALGGISGPYGAVLGTLAVFGLPLFARSLAGIASTGIGLGGLAVILMSPTGLYGAWIRLRNKIIERLAPITVGDVTAASASRPEQPRTPITAVRDRRAPGDITAPSGAPALEVVGLTKSFGGVNVLGGVDLHVARGEIVTLIGPNGAGKTTTFDAVTGFVRPDSGTVRLHGQDVTGFTPPQLVRRGLVRTYQDAALFATLTVAEVLDLAAAARDRWMLLSSVVGLDRSRSARTERVESALEHFGLVHYRGHRIAELSTGTRRIVELASSVLLGADVLLLDEPSAGIAQREVEQLGAALLSFRADHATTILLIEHDIPLCRGVGDRMVVMADGQVIASGRPDEVVTDPVVIDRYLGSDSAALERSGT